MNATFAIGDRVVRPIFARNTLHTIVGWKRGTVVGISTEEARNIHQEYPVYTVRWDGEATAQGGYLGNGSLTREEEAALPPA